MQGDVLSIIKQAASELGLPVPVEGVASRDQTSIQLVSLLNSAGYDLVFSHDWEELIKVATITTVAEQEEYSLPSDYARLIKQTMWGNGGLISGPVSPQQWQVIKLSDGVSGDSTKFRIRGNKILLNPTPATAGITYNFEYVSDGWVQSYTSPGTYTNLIPNDKAIPIFDFFLMVKFLKLKLWQAKGFDTTGLTTDLDRLFVGLTSAKGAPVIYLTKGVYGGGDLHIEIPTETPSLGFPYTFPFRLG